MRAQHNIYDEVSNSSTLQTLFTASDSEMAVHFENCELFRLLPGFLSLAIELREAFSTTPLQYTPVNRMKARTCLFELQIVNPSSHGNDLAHTAGNVSKRYPSPIRLPIAVKIEKLCIAKSFKSLRTTIAPVSN
jgi:hypothetical protein